MSASFAILGSALSTPALAWLHGSARAASVGHGERHEERYRGRHRRWYDRAHDRAANLEGSVTQWNVS